MQKLGMNMNLMQRVVSGSKEPDENAETFKGQGFNVKEEALNCQERNKSIFSTLSLKENEKAISPATPEKEITKLWDFINALSRNISEEVDIIKADIRALKPQDVTVDSISGDLSSKREILAYLNEASMRLKEQMSGELNLV